MYSIVTLIKDTDLGPMVVIVLMDRNGFPLLELSEDQWKELVNDSWDMLSKANAKLYELVSKGKYKVDPFLIPIDRSVL